MKHSIILLLGLFLIAACDGVTDDKGDDGGDDLAVLGKCDTSNGIDTERMAESCLRSMIQQNNYPEKIRSEVQKLQSRRYGVTGEVSSVFLGTRQMPTGKRGTTRQGAAYLTCTNLERNDSTYAICTTILSRQGEESIVFGAKVVTDKEMTSLLD